MRFGDYLGTIESVEVRGRHLWLRFDALPREDAFLPKKPGTAIEHCEDFGAIVVEVNARVAEIEKYVGLRTLREGDWCAFNLANDRSEGIEALAFVGQAGEVPSQRKVKIRSSQPLRSAQRHTLAQTFRLPPTSKEGIEAIKQRVHAALEIGGAQDYAVNVYSVGQGSSTAVATCYGLPVVYFDHGRGCYGNERTYKKSVRLCYTNDPGIVLSHWDADHWFIGYVDRRAQELPWVAPVQSVGPVATQFAAMMVAQRNIAIIPRMSAPLEFGPLKVFQCTGHSRNDSGFAALVNVAAGKMVLLPGDATYTHVPNARSTQWSGAVCTHHGGKFRGPPPVPCGSARMVISVGAGNTYEHPKTSAVCTYKSAGWSLCETRKKGHIVMLSRGGKYSFPQPCARSGSAVCDSMNFPIVI